MPFLAYVAFAIVAVAVLLYVLMDGWDLGVGILFPIAARERERDEMMESIAPFWDGNKHLAGIRRSDIIRRVSGGLCFDAAGSVPASNGDVVRTGVPWNFI